MPHRASFSRALVTAVGLEVAWPVLLGAGRVWVAPASLTLACRSTLVSCVWFP